MEQLQVLTEQNILNQNFKIYGTQEEPMFLAKDVADWIEHSQTSKMLQSIDEDEKLTGTLFLSGQKREMWFLTEAGMYEVLMQSRKPIAKQFKKKVKEILKELRLKGHYELPKDPMEIMRLQFEALDQTNKKVDTIEKDVTYLKDEVKLDAGEYNFIAKHVRRNVMEIIQRFGFADTQEVKQALFKDINNGLNEVCGIKTRTQLRQKHFNKAMDYINVWVPSTATRLKVQQLTLEFADDQEGGQANL